MKKTDETLILCYERKREKKLCFSSIFVFSSQGLMGAKTKFLAEIIAHGGAR